MGDRIRGLLGEAWNAYSAGRPKERDRALDLTRIAEDYGLDLTTPEGWGTAADEYLVRLAERGESNSFLDRLLVRLRNWLKQVFPDLKVTRADLVELIAKARGYAERGRAGRDTSALAKQLSRPFAGDQGTLRAQGPHETFFSRTGGENQQIQENTRGPKHALFRPVIPTPSRGPYLAETAECLARRPWA